jgi:hypothetical protein
MHGLDELERAPPSSGKALARAPDPSPRRRLRPRAAAETRIPTEKLVPYPVSEEHEGGQYADKRSHATPGLDARGTAKAGLDREGVTGLADRHERVRLSARRRR